MKKPKGKHGGAARRARRSDAERNMRKRRTGPTPPPRDSSPAPGEWLIFAKPCRWKFVVHA